MKTLSFLALAMSVTGFASASIYAREADYDFDAGLYARDYEYDSGLYARDFGERPTLTVRNAFADADPEALADALADLYDYHLARRGNEYKQPGYPKAGSYEAKATPGPDDVMSNNNARAKAFAAEKEAIAKSPALQAVTEQKGLNQAAAFAGQPPPMPVPKRRKTTSF